MVFDKLLMVQSDSCLLIQRGRGAYISLHGPIHWSGARPRTDERARESVTAADATAASAIGCSCARSFRVRCVGWMRGGKCEVSRNRCFDAATPTTEKARRAPHEDRGHAGREDLCGAHRRTAAVASERASGKHFGKTPTQRSRS